MKNNQKGRSMVEMLGVLAIVGVLSAGALKGYSAAMFKYKMNQSIDIFQKALQRFSEIEQTGIGEGTIIDTTEDFVAYGFLDECQKTSDSICRLPIGDFGAYFEDYGAQGLRGEFEMTFTDSKSCIAFASAGWENAMQKDWLNPCGTIRIGNMENGSDPTYLYDPNECYENGAIQVTMENIVNGCKVCNEDGGCTYSFAIHGYI